MDTWYEVEHYLEDFGEWWIDNDPQFNPAHPRWPSEQSAIQRANQIFRMLGHNTKVIKVEQKRTTVYDIVRDGFK